MGRSVSSPRHTVFHTYLPFIYDEENEDTWEYQDFKENLQYNLIEKYKSLSPCDKWIDREDHAILENDHSYIGISEYCGLVCLWGVCKEDYIDRYDNDRGLAENWLCQVGIKIDDFLAKIGYDVYIKQGTFSNGEGVYFKKG